MCALGNDITPIVMNPLSMCSEGGEIHITEKGEGILVSSFIPTTIFGLSG